MGIIGRIKGFYGKVRAWDERRMQKFQAWDQHRILIKNINKSIEISKDPIPELTARQKDDIQKYWNQFGFSVPYEWHRLFYAKTGRELPDYVPKTTFNENIRPCMNDNRLAGAWSDKAYLDYFIKAVKTPVCVIRNVSGRFLDSQFRLISMEQAQKLINGHDRLVIKPTLYTHTGHGVALLDRPYDLKTIDEQYKQDYVMQLPLKQHEGMKRFNASSINTIRVDSVLFGEEAHIMSSFVKVGEAGQFADNSGSDRYFIGIRVKDGVLADYAIDHDMNRHLTIPSGYQFANQKVPCFEKLKTSICRAHECIPHFGFAFWDVCIDEAGDPVVVEVNLRNPDSAIAQATGEPFLGEYTQAIIEYISHRKMSE